MRAIVKTIKPKICANIMNHIQSILVTKNKKEVAAVQKLIDKYGYADIYVYCSKGNKKDWHLIEVVDTDTGWEGYEYDYYIGSKGYLDWCLESKIVAKFTVRKVEDIYECFNVLLPEKFTRSKYCDNTFTGYITPTIDHIEFLEKSCLTKNEIHKYFYTNKTQPKIRKCGYAYHIEDLVIFDKPKELSEFYEFGEPINEPIMNAPQSYRYCFVESEE